MSATQQSKKAKKAASPPAHPTYEVMIKAAIVSQKERNGSSRQAIIKYIKQNYKVGNNVDTMVRTQLPRLVKKKALLQVKGKGASGSFKVAKPTVEEKKKSAAKKKAKKPAAKKAAKKPAEKKKAPKAKKAASKKKPSPKKAKKPAAKKAGGSKTAKKSPAKGKKPSAKKSAKKPGAKKAAKKK